MKCVIELLMLHINHIDGLKYNVHMICDDDKVFMIEYNRNSREI